MFEQIEELKQRRAELRQQLDEVNAAIQAEFASVDQALTALRDELAPHGRDTAKRAYVFDPSQNKAKREAQSRRMKEAWAKRKANGQPWKQSPVAEVADARD